MRIEITWSNVDFYWKNFYHRQLIFFFFATVQQRIEKYLIYLIVIYEFKSYDSVVFHHHLFSRSLFISIFSTFFFFYLFLVFVFFFSFFSFIFFFFLHFQVILFLSLWRGENIFKNLYSSISFIGKKLFENWIDMFHSFTVVNHLSHLRYLFQLTNLNALRIYLIDR